MRRLRELGCAYGQGFLFSRPLQADRAAELVARAGVAAAAGWVQSDIVVWR